MKPDELKKIRRDFAMDVDALCAMYSRRSGDQVADGFILQVLVGRLVWFLRAHNLAKADAVAHVAELLEHLWEKTPSGRLTEARSNTYWPEFESITNNPSFSAALYALINDELNRQVMTGLAGALMDAAIALISVRGPPVLHAFRWAAECKLEEAQRLLKNNIPKAWTELETARALLARFLCVKPAQDGVGIKSTFDACEPRNIRPGP
jgi:hypothetical protein